MNDLRMIDSHTVASIVLHIHMNMNIYDVFHVALRYGVYTSHVTVLQIDSRDEHEGDRLGQFVKPPGLLEDVHVQEPKKCGPAGEGVFAWP